MMFPGTLKFSSLNLLNDLRATVLITVLLDADSEFPTLSQAYPWAHCSEPRSLRKHTTPKIPFSWTRGSLIAHAAKTRCRATKSRGRVPLSAGPGGVAHTSVLRVGIFSLVFLCSSSPDGIDCDQ